MKKDCQKKCTGARAAKKCDKAEAKVEAKAIGIDLAKVGQIATVVAKIPAWVTRARSELKQLSDRIVKLDAFLSKLADLVASKKATKEDREALAMAKRQRKAMGDYKSALEARIAKAVEA